VRNLLDQGVPGEVIRFVFLGTQYSKPMDWTAKKAEEAKRRLQGYYRIVGDDPATDVPRWFVNALADDLNTPLAVSMLDEIANEGDPGTLRASANLLGLMTDRFDGWFIERDFGGGGLTYTGDSAAFADRVWEIAKKWDALRKSKDFEAADRVKRLALEAGITLRATSVGPWADLPNAIDPAKLERIQ
jgi:cysteinyl-tRNA synthetase